MVVDIPVYTFTFCAQDYTSFLAGAIKASSHRTTTGLVIHQAGFPHFDVLVTPLVNALFFAALAANFGLNPIGGDAEALETLRRNAQSQHVTTDEEFENIVPDDELAEQLAAMEVIRVYVKLYCSNDGLG